MIQGKWFPAGGDIALPLSLRQQIFGQGRDGIDALAQQAVVYQEGQPVGCARLWWADGAFMLGGLGVLPAFRGRGFGDLLVRLTLYKALTHSASVIALDAAPEVVPFFAKYGFAPAGDGRGPLVRMTIRGQDVQLSHCGGNCEGCQSRSEACTPKALR